ncbi:MAG: dihydropteroate synthase [Clostridia bacterium]|nr:dihydropteroate synthase [Clostridia bacterium]
MIIIGEKLNSSIKSVYNAIKDKDEDFIKSLIVNQQAAGADYLDVNAGAFLDEEEENLVWLLDKVSKYSSIAPVIDTPDSELALKIAKNYSGPDPIINSITLEQPRFDNMLNAAKCCNAGLVALCVDDESDDIPSIAYKLSDKLVQNGLDYSKIYIDPLIKPLSSGEGFGLEALNNIKLIRKELPDIHIVCGLSNISYGLPKRAVLNRAFLTCAMLSGLDSAIINPLDKDLMSCIYAADVILDNDEYCMNYIQAYKEQKI